jgi:hypothetical protein
MLFLAHGRFDYGNHGRGSRRRKAIAPWPPSSDGVSSAGTWRRLIPLPRDGYEGFKRSDPESCKWLSRSDEVNRLQQRGHPLVDDLARGVGAEAVFAAGGDARTTMPTAPWYSTSGTDPTDALRGGGRELGSGSEPAPAPAPGWGGSTSGLMTWPSDGPVLAAASMVGSFVGRVGGRVPAPACRLRRSAGASGATGQRSRFRNHERTSSARGRARAPPPTERQ